MTFQISRRDLIATEPRGALVDHFVVAVTAPLKDVLAAPGLFALVQPMLRAGDDVTLLRFTDANRQRLAERAAAVITQSLPGGQVDFALAGPISEMPEPKLTTMGRVAETMTVARIEHDYRLKETFDEANRNTFWQVMDGDGDRSIEAPFKSRDAAEEFLAYQLKAFPDWVVTNAVGAAVSATFRTREEATSWMRAETQRRQTERIA